jgi:hypothetical protein
MNQDCEESRSKVEVSYSRKFHRVRHGFSRGGFEKQSRCVTAAKIPASKEDSLIGGASYWTEGAGL